MDVFIARQPIFLANKRLFGYELLFRDSMSNVFPDIGGDTATSRVFSNTFSSIDMEKLSGGKLMFINFTEELLVRQIPKLFPKDKLMVEILEDVQPDDAVIGACRNIQQAGYHIALDDFLFKPELLPLVGLADTIKFDFRLTPIESIATVIDRLSGYPLKFLAEKVETHAEFECALDLGFSYFQGYFFCKPEILSGKDIAPNKLLLLQVVAEINREGGDIGKLSEMISKDVSLTYKLLRYINSAYFTRPQEIRSVRHAMVMLGDREVKKFLSVVATAEIANEKPSELLRSSIIRARMCELISQELQVGLDRYESFLTGMFSRIDAMLDNTLENIVEKLPLSGSIEKALVRGEGLLHDVLKVVACFESGDWANFSIAAAGLNVDPSNVPKMYFEAVHWADSYTS